MATGLYFIVLLCLTSGLWSGANAQLSEQKDNGCVTCPAGWSQFGDHCYIYHFTGKDWADAEVTCVSLGGNLASVHNQDQYTFLKNMVNRSTGSDVEFWIGGQDATKEGVWLFSDGSVFEFKLWPAGEPNNFGGSENCMVSTFKGNPNDINCFGKKSFFCGKRL